LVLARPSNPCGIGCYSYSTLASAVSGTASAGRAEIPVRGRDVWRWNSARPGAACRTFSFSSILLAPGRLTISAGSVTGEELSMLRNVGSLFGKSRLAVGGKPLHRGSRAKRNAVLRRLVHWGGRAWRSPNHWAKMGKPLAHGCGCAPARSRQCCLASRLSWLTELCKKGLRSAPRR